MHISGLTSSQVWLSSSRSLTNIGSGALAATSAVQTTLAATVSVDLRPSAGTVGLITATGQTGAAATGSVAIFAFDGTNVILMTQSNAAANANISFTGVNTNAAGFQIKNNDATVAAKYITNAWVFTI